MNTHPLIRFFAAGLLPLFMLASGTASAQQAGDPPARVAALSQIEGSVAFAPPGETEWADATLNRPVTRGDRLWTDRGARAEVHAGSAVLHLDGQTFLDIAALDDDELQASLNEGIVNARVRQLRAGENFEIDTPQLAFRAAQPGDYRIDVDPQQGTTRVTVRQGAALVYGAGGQSQRLEGAQVVTFAGRDLERVAVQASPLDDGFDRWAAERNRAEDQSIAARYVPREVVGYQTLDTYGNWDQDASYGAVWYPRVTVVDWAPYRYGHWDFIAPWGWTWIDDAPWGFAPFHYGRWAMIGSRWAWVPGRIGPRPVYSPALVAFVGGSGGVSFSFSFGSGIGWFPLGPGELWQPAYRTSPIYVTNVNRYVVVNNQAPRYYVNQRRPAAVTAVAVEDFGRGRPVNRHWKPVSPADLGRVQVLAQPSLPQPRRFVEQRAVRTQAAPPPLAASPAPVQPRAAFANPGASRRDPAEMQRPAIVPRTQETPRAQGPDPRVQQERAQREQERAMREQERAAREQDRARRDMQAQQERVQREQQAQRDHAMRQQQAQERAQEQAQRQQQAAQERAMRQQQAAQERAVRQQQEQAVRQQQQAAQQAQERAIRQQQAAQAQEQQQRMQQQQQQRAMRVQPPPPPQAAPQEAPPQQQPREGRGRGRQEREQQRDQRDDNRSQGGDEGWRGRGHRAG